MKVEEKDFPLETNETIQAAFEAERKFKHTARILSEALANALMDMEVSDPWETVHKERPEIIDFIKTPGTKLAFSPITNTIVLK